MHIEASSVPLEIRLLGPLEVVRDGVAVVLAGRRERSILAFLASNAGEPVSVDRLVAFLWADDEPRTADKTLQTYMSRLRRALGGDLLARREAGYALVVPRDAVDAIRFRDLLVQGRHLQQAGDDDRALAIYRRALDEWRGEQPAAAPDTPEAMAWRQGLVAGRLDALEASMALLVRGGRHQEAAAELEQLVVREPFRDELWALLMEALAGGGRPAAALDAYQRARRRLSDELGLDPSPRLQELQRRIIMQQTGPEAGQAATVRDEPATRRRRGVAPPAALTPIIGRASELRRLTAELAGARLATVVGTGGVGKTRLVMEVAARWPAPVAFCDLAVVREPGAVGHALAAAAGVDPEPGGDPVEATAAALGERTLLLVVDNCEHLVPQVRRHLYVLLSRCPNLTVVATSRQALGMDGEVVVLLAPLRVGDDGGDAARLFVERVRHAGAMIPHDVASGALVRSICAALDGIPLAIELAAAMAGVLSLDDLQRNLVDRFTLLQAPRLLAGRERNLRDTVEWSYRLLDPPAQRLLRRAAVFAGPFTADAAAQVCADDGDARTVPALLTGLAARSLLERSDGRGHTRYRMLETIREYGRDVLDADEWAALDRAHAGWAVQLAQELATQRFGPDERQVVERFDEAVADLRVACRWALRAGDADIALPLIIAVHWFAFLDMRAELFGWAVEAVDRFRDTAHPLLGDAVGSAITWQMLQGDVAGVARNEAFLRHIVDGGHDAGLLARGVGASVAARRGDFDAAYRDIALAYELDPSGHAAMLAEGNIIVIEHYAGHVDAARRRGADLGPRMAATGVPSLQAFGALATAMVMKDDDPDAAIVQLRRALAFARDGRTLVTERIVLSQMAGVAALASDPRAAHRALADALGAWQRDGLWRMEWGTLHSLMELLARSGRHRDLLVLHAAEQASTTAPPLLGDQRDRLTSAVERARRELGADAAAAALAHGHGLTNEQAVAFARVLVSARVGGGPFDPPADAQLVVRPT